MAKNQKIGAVFKGKDGRPFIVLGNNKAKNEKYHCSIEITVKDSKGKVIAKQKDGFINLIDPRKEPQRLLELNLISEQEAATMEERVQQISEKLLFDLSIKKEA